MIDISPDAVWQFIGYLLTLLAIAAAFVIYYLQTQRKELAFGTLSVRSLLTVSEELANRVVVSFDGSPIENIQLLVLGIKNSGDKPILAADFERPFSIEFGSRAKVLSADITKQSPTNLSASISTAENHVQLLPLLLNPGDYVVVKILLTADKVEVISDSRIVGISKLVPLNEGMRLRPGAIRNLGQNILILLGLLFVFAALDYFGFFKSPPPQPKNPSSPWTYLWLGGFICLTFFFGPLRDWIVGRLRNNARRYIDET